MTDVVCTVCGSDNARVLAPGFYECEAEVLDGVVPAGAQGNPQPVPLYRRCGNRFQSGIPAGVGAAQCDCGMFAVGLCIECGRPFCGQHVQSVAGKVFCDTCARPARAEEAASRDRESAAAARAQIAHRKARREFEAEILANRAALIPGYPLGQAARPNELLPFLRQHVPVHAGRFVIGPPKLGISPKMNGWGIRISSSSTKNERWGGLDWRHEGLLIGDKGAFRVQAAQRSPEWIPTPAKHSYYTHPRIPQAANLSVEDVAKVLDQILVWTGRA